MSNESLPQMHYITEHERVQIHPAVVRCISIPSIPSDFPFNVPISAERQYRGPRFTIGWLEFQSPEQPDPEVARPGDVWIQLPSGHRKARVYACYNPEGKDWSPWAGNNLSLGGRSNTPMHPFLNDHAQRKFYLVFNGSKFTWSNPKAVSIIMHAHPQIFTMGPAEVVIKWLKVTGVGRTSPSPVEKVVRSTSVPMVNRKRGRPEQSGPLGDSASAPPAKKPRDGPMETSPTTQSGLTLRLPRLRPSVQGSATGAALPKNTNKAPEKPTPRRVCISSVSVGASNCAPFLENSFRDSHSLAVAHSDLADIRRSSPLSFVHEPANSVQPHSESAMLDARDDAAVENMLDSTVVMSATPPLNASGESEPVAQGSATNNADDAGSDGD